MSENDDGFVVATDDNEYETDYVVLTTDVGHNLAESFGYAFDDDLVDMNTMMETSVEDTHTTDAMIHAEGWQAVISTDDGVAAALNTLSKERGEHYYDFDVPADAEFVFGSLVNKV